MNIIKATETKVPLDLGKALASKPAAALWKDLTPISRRDFITWIESAKQEETRKRRIEVTLSKLAKGERRPCCYAVVPMNFYKALGTDPKAKAVWKELTANEKRDVVAWIDEAKNKEEHALRIEKARIKLSKGNKYP